MADLTPEQSAARAMRKSRRALRRAFAARRTPSFMDRLAQRMEEDKRLLERLKENR